MSTLYVNKIVEETTNNGVHIPGHVIQAVQSTYGTQQSTTSTSYVTSNLSATITPKFNTSKIRISVMVCIYAPTAVYNRLTIFRGGVSSGTNLAVGQGGSTDSFSAMNMGGTSWVPCHIGYLDSPSTTSATIYELAYKTASSTSYIHNGYTFSSMILEEIAQ